MNNEPEINSSLEGYVAYFDLDPKVFLLGISDTLAFLISKHFARHLNT